LCFWVSLSLCAIYSEGV